MKGNKPLVTKEVVNHGFSNGRNEKIDYRQSHSGSVNKIK